MIFNNYVKAIVFKNDSGVEMDVREGITYLHVKLNDDTEFKGKVLSLHDDSFTLTNSKAKEREKIIQFSDIKEMYYSNPLEL